MLVEALPRKYSSFEAFVFYGHGRNREKNPQRKKPVRSPASLKAVLYPAAGVGVSSFLQPTFSLCHFFVPQDGLLGFMDVSPLLLCFPKHLPPFFRVLMNGFLRENWGMG